MPIQGNFSTNLNEVTFPEFVDLFRRQFEEIQALPKLAAGQLFMHDDIMSGNGASKLYEEFDIDTFARSKPEGTNLKKSKVAVGYTKIMYAATLGSEIDITLELRNDNRYQEVGRRITSLSSFCEQRKELDLTHRLTFANATSYVNMDGETVDTTVGDGLAVLSTVHTLSASPLLYSNRLAGDPVFSQGAYEAALLLSSTQIYSNLGQKRVLDFPTIVASSDDPYTMRVVKQLIRSTADVDAVQSGIVNTYQGTKDYLFLPYLATTALGSYDSTKRKWWFLVSKQWQAHIGMWIYPKLTYPSAGGNGEDIHNLNWTFSTYNRYGIVVLSGRGIIGSCPTTA